MSLEGRKYRHEFKYYINHLDYMVLRAKLKALLPLDTHAQDEDGYNIRSLYFDNLTDSDLYKKNYGILQRKKIRIRIYNNSDSVIKLERKYRYGEYVCKESGSLSKNEYSNLLNNEYDFLLKKENPLYQDFYLYIRSENLTPRVIVDYKREAYVGSESDVRITFDKGLSAGINSFDIFERDLTTVEALPNPLLIMEVKFNEYLPSYIRSVLGLHAHNRSAISKYVICREVGKKFYKE